MKIPARLTVHDSAYFLDGGTISLRAIDEVGKPRRIMLMQRYFPSPGSGQLFLDDELVPMRSPQETELLGVLRTAEIRATPSPIRGERLSENALILGDDIRAAMTRGPEENLRAFLAEVIAFVASEDYLRWSQREEQSCDTTRYTIWAAWDETSRNRVSVRLGSLLAIGLAAAREMLEKDTPLAIDISALQVAELASKYAAEGLKLRVEPPFRWPVT